MAASGLAAANAGHQIPDLYRMATAGLSIQDSKIVQRRIKEAILKCAILYGIPRSGQALGPLYRILGDDEIDDFSPRSEVAGSREADERRARRGREYFDTLWTPVGAEEMRNRVRKYHPDHQLVNMTIIYEHWVSEDAILSNVETQMCNTVALECIDSPVQALWHTRGIVRHGGTLEDARFAQDFGVAVANQFGCRTGELTKVDDIQF
ncbi:putative carboxymuconolactone decarboxylase protein [Neofusicoccum parvum UCRNP2]|uniref:Putative carboxymuconolactone decarboxylase protein n=1 Tax=Botryosphaeria parva (strain UCR-NP2) TaxID=1287680 RepID=R1E921_BOTPV|nr:putative carboxymuconolactone decarboxylase protein [Neofusicoccum parvum UCRNP2]